MSESQRCDSPQTCPQSVDNRWPTWDLCPVVPIEPDAAQPWLAMQSLRRGSCRALAHGGASSTRRASASGVTLDLSSSTRRRSRLQLVAGADATSRQPLARSPAEGMKQPVGTSFGPPAARGLAVPEQRHDPLPPVRRSGTWVRRRGRLRRCEGQPRPASRRRSPSRSGGRVADGTRRLTRRGHQRHRLAAVAGRRRASRPRARRTARAARRTRCTGSGSRRLRARRSLGSGGGSPFEKLAIDRAAIR